MVKIIKIEQNRTLMIEHRPQDSEDGAGATHRSEWCCGFGDGGAGSYGKDDGNKSR
jgi:hypothetical protein